MNFSTAMKKREQTQLSLTRKLRFALLNCVEYSDDIEVLTIGGGFMETLTDEELTMMIRLMTSEMMQRQGLMG